MAHWQYYAGADLKNPDDRDAVISALISYLADHNPNVVGHAYTGSDPNLRPPIRPKDYWALVLAGLLKRDMVIMAYDSDNVRDQKIAAFVSDVREKH